MCNGTVVVGFKRERKNQSLMMSLSSFLMICIPLLCSAGAGAIAKIGGAGYWSIGFALTGLAIGFGLGSVPIAYTDLALIKKQWRPNPIFKACYEAYKLFALLLVPAFTGWLCYLAVHFVFVPKP